MDYFKHYANLIEKAKNRKNNQTQYYEVHHIIPRSIGGSDEQHNLILLTAREHFVAHWLLWRLFPDEVSLMKAFKMMLIKNTKQYRDFRVNSRIYQTLKEEYSKYLSIKLTEDNPMWDYKAKEKLSKANSGENNSMYNIKLSYFQRKKLSEIQKGKVFFTNGTDNIKCFPGNEPDGFYRGFTIQKYYWFNNGKYEAKYLDGKEPKGFVKGRLKRVIYNNGKKEIRIKENKTPPKGFVKGKSPSSKFGASSKEIVCENQTFNSIKEASNKLNINYETLRARLKNKKYEAYYYLY